MAEQTERAARAAEAADEKPELDERRVARAVAIGLPLLTILLAIGAAVTTGAAMAILILAAGVLLGVIGLFWASLRVLSGDAPISPELEALDAKSQAVDALASRKTMLVRALKDLDVEKSLGKLDDDDHAQLSATYRGELKEVLRKIDASLEPLRPKAEEAVKRHLAKAGVAAKKTKPEQPADDEAPAEAEDDANDTDGPNGTDDATPDESAAPARVDCPACKTTNEADAAFCKKCGKPLAIDRDEKADDATSRVADAKESS